MSLEVRKADRMPTAESAAANSAATSCPFHAGRADGRGDAAPRTMVLTGASRGIGHATVKLFSEAGWRVITCSRQPFDRGRCPWDAGADNHVQIDLGDRQAVPRAIADIKARLAGAPLHALVNNAAISPKDTSGGRID